MLHEVMRHDCTHGGAQSCGEMTFLLLVFQVPGTIHDNLKLSSYALEHLGLARSEQCTVVMPGGQQLQRSFVVHKSIGKHPSGSITRNWSAVCAALALSGGQTLNVRRERGVGLELHLRNNDAGSTPATFVHEEDQVNSPQLIFRKPMPVEVIKPQ